MLPAQHLTPQQDCVVCQNPWLTIYPIDFTLGKFIVEGSRQCSVECEVFWVSGSKKLQAAAKPEATQSIPSHGHVSNGQRGT